MAQIASRGTAVLAAIAMFGLLAAQPASAAGSGSFSPTGSMGTPRIFAAAASLPGGRVLIVGGSVDGGASAGLASTEIYNPATGAFAAGPSLGVIRNGPVAASLADGRVLIAGGRGPLSSAQIYNPATNSFSGTGFMQDAREGAAAARLADGRVLVAGGVEGSTYLETAEIWDPATNLWTPAGSMSKPRYSPGAAPLPGGKVLVAGGYGPGLHDSAEVYDPATNSFGPGNPVAELLSTNFGLRGPAAAALPDGRVLIAGGDQAGGATLAFAEAFDSATGQFSPTGIGPLGTPRGWPAAAPLGDGRILVAGGSTGSGITATAEVFAATNTFTYTLSGTKLLVTVAAPGTVEVRDAAVPAAASTSKKRKPKPLFSGGSASGGPGTIVIPLVLRRTAKQALRQRGKVKLRATITFTPVGGVPNLQPVRLKVRRAKKK